MSPTPRFAQELADVIAHSLSVVSVQAQAAEAYLERDAGQAREHLDAVRRTAHDALAEMRRLCAALSQDVAARLPQPTLDRVCELVDEARDAGIRVVVVEEGERRDVPPGVSLTAFRILQEALANVLTHAGAASAAVRVAYRPDRIELAISAPGVTTSPAALDAIRERAQLYGGALDAGAEPDGTFAVRAWLPL